MDQDAVATGKRRLGRAQKLILTGVGAFVIAGLGAAGTNAGDRIWGALPWSGSGTAPEPNVELTANVLETSSTRADFYRRFRHEPASAAAGGPTGPGLVIEVHAASDRNVACALRWTVVDVSTTRPVEAPGFESHAADDATIEPARCPFRSRIWVPLPPPRFPHVLVRLEAVDRNGEPLRSVETPALTRTSNAG